MPTAYAQLSDVEAILRGKIRFSNAIHSIVKTYSAGDASTIMLSPVGITMDSAYEGYRKLFEIVFENPADLTEYRIYRELSSDGARSIAYLATGHTNAVLNIPNYMDIAPAAWSGNAMHGDIIHLITNSHMSIDVAESFINDVEAEVDQLLRRESIIHTEEGTIPDDLYFNVNPPVPRQIKIAVAHISAFRIINYIFDAVRSINPMNYSKEEGFTLTEQDFAIAAKWDKIGKQALKDWLETYKVQRAGNAPRYSSIGTLQDKIGVRGELYSDNMETQIDADPFSDDEVLDTQNLLDYYTNNE